jgi:hypothetical protein
MRRIVLIIGITMLARDAMSQPTTMPVGMPGKSYSGALPALTDAVQQLASRLKAHVEMLAGRFGERNVDKPDALEQAAAYIETLLEKLGYEVGRQEYLRS